MSFETKVEEKILVNAIEMQLSPVGTLQFQVYFRTKQTFKDACIG